MEMIEVSIIIVNYNTLELTDNCIESIFKYTKDVSFEVILVDNASTDGSVEFFENKDKIRFVQSKVNLGFGRANNLGAKYAKGKYLFLLNSDCLLLNNAVLYFLNYFESAAKSNTAGLGSYLYDINLQPAISGGYFPSLKRELRYWFSYYVPQKTNSVFSLKNITLEFVSGANLFIKKNIFDRYNGFDSNIFMYFEETDLQYRLRKSGYIFEFIDTPQIIHLEGKSFQFSTTKNLFYNSSRYYYFKKHNNVFVYYIFRVLETVFSLPIILFGNTGNKFIRFKLLFKKINV